MVERTSNLVQIVSVVNVSPAGQNGAANTVLVKGIMSKAINISPRPRLILAVRNKAYNCQRRSGKESGVHPSNPDLFCERKIPVCITKFEDTRKECSSFLNNCVIKTMTIIWLKGSISHQYLKPLQI